MILVCDACIKSDCCKYRDTTIMLFKKIQKFNDSVKKDPVTKDYPVHLELGCNMFDSYEQYLRCVKVE